MLKGNLAPGGSVVKHSAVPKEMHQAVLKARPFDSEEEAIHAILTTRSTRATRLFIRYEGPKGSGMPEMFYTTEAISSDPELAASIAPDHRRALLRGQQGTGHRPREPRGRRGRPIALVEEGDLIQNSEIARVLRVCGLHGKEASEEEIAAEFARRKQAWKPKEPRYKTGILGLFTRNAASPMEGGYMD